MRAFRPGALVLGALQQTALAYLRRDGDAIPFWRMAQTPVPQLLARAEAISADRSVTTSAMTGGGSLPGEEIPSAGIQLDGDVATGLRKLRYPLLQGFVIKPHSSTFELSIPTTTPWWQTQLPQLFDQCTSSQQQATSITANQPWFGHSRNRPRPIDRRKRTRSNDRFGICIYRSFLGSKAVIH